MLKLPALINYSVSLCGDPRLWVAWSTVDNFRKELYKNRTSHCAQKMGTVFLWIVRELKRIRSNFTWIQFISRRLYCQISWMYIRNGSFSHRNSASNVSFGVIEVRCPFKWIDHLQIFIKSNYIVVFFWIVWKLFDKIYDWFHQVYPIFLGSVRKSNSGWISHRECKSPTPFLSNPIKLV